MVLARGAATKSRRRRGFTMIELMVVVVIVALLAAMAVPIYKKYVKSSRVSEATTRIGEILTASRSWAMDHQNAGGDPTWPSKGGGIVDLSASPNFTYAFTSGAGTNARTTTLRITATGKAKTPMSGVRVQVTVRNVSANASAPTITGL